MIQKSQFSVKLGPFFEVDSKSAEFHMKNGEKRAARYANWAQDDQLKKIFFSQKTLVIGALWVTRFQRSGSYVNSRMWDLRKIPSMIACMIHK